MPKLSKYDVIIIGAGIIGLASSYHILRKNPDLDILMVDMLGWGEGNTSKSAAAFRNTFSSKTNQLLTDSSIDFYLHIQNDIRFDIGLKKIGYLWLLTREQYNSYKIQHALESMEKGHIEYKIIKKQELKKIPGLNLEIDENEEMNKKLHLKNIYVGILGAKCGILDPGGLSKFYFSEYKKQGGEFEVGKVDGLILEPRLFPGENILTESINQNCELSGKKISKIRFKDKEIQADRIIVSTGAWANNLLDRIGIDSYIKAKKRQIFAVHTDNLVDLHNVTGFNNLNIVPFIILPRSGVYLRPETENVFWLGCADNIGREFESPREPLSKEEFMIQPKAEKDYYTQIISIVTAYFSQFVRKDTNTPINYQNSWAGYYGYNTIDKNPYIFKRASAIIVVGASGSGIMKADAIGRIVEKIYSLGKQEIENFKQPRKKLNEEAKVKNDDIYAELFTTKEYEEKHGKRLFNSSDLGIDKRNVDMEYFII